ncbi:MAG: hypothetical protein JNM56_10280 [Planctomycetia bacterium]|nr:hypothetical protein [Planctomycetia bacterium]
MTMIAFSLDHALSQQEARKRLQQHLVTAKPPDTLWNDFWVETDVMGFRIEFWANRPIRVIRGEVRFKEGAVEVTAEPCSSALAPVLPEIEEALSQAARQALAAP